MNACAQQEILRYVYFTECILSLTSKGLNCKCLGPQIRQYRDFTLFSIHDFTEFLFMYVGFSVDFCTAAKYLMFTFVKE